MSKILWVLRGPFGRAFPCVSGHAVLCSVLLGVACSDADDTSNAGTDGPAEMKSSQELEPGGTVDSADAGVAPEVDLNTIVGTITTGIEPLCLEVLRPEACVPPEASIGAQPDAVVEVNLTDSPDRKDGEPNLVINPTDPNNLVVIYASFLPGMILTDEAYNCHAKYSMDRGQTWTLVEPWPPEGTGPFPDCGESVVKVDAHGTFYAGMNNLLNTGDVDTGLDANLDKAVHIVSRSEDGGRTWSVPVETFQIAGVVKSRVDLATGKLYHSVSYGGLFPSAMTVSSDRGDTWAQPVTQPGGQFAVHEPGRRFPATGTG